MSNKLNLPVELLPNAAYSSNRNGSSIIMAMPTSRANYKFVLPQDMGFNGQFLKTSGVEDLYWGPINIPIYTTLQRTSLSFETGALVYDTDLSQAMMYNGTVWLSIGGGGGGGTVFADDVFRITNASITSKQMAFDCSLISDSTTRTITIPDRNFSLDYASLMDQSVASGESPSWTNSISLTRNAQTLTLAASATASGTYTITLPPAVNTTAGMLLKASDTAGTLAWTTSTRLDNLTDAEITQLENINAATITSSQWGYLSALNQSVASGASPSWTNSISLTRNAQTLSLAASATASSTYTITLPPAVNTTAGMLLKASDTAGTLAWTTSTRLDNLTDAEITQLENINANVISTANWTRLAALDQSVSTLSSPNWVSPMAKTSLKIRDPVGATFSSTIQAPTLSADYTMTLPTSNPTVLSGLMNDSTGQLRWQEDYENASNIDLYQYPATYSISGGGTALKTAVDADDGTGTPTAPHVYEITDSLTYTGVDGTSSGTIDLKNKHDIVIRGAIGQRPILSSTTTLVVWASGTAYIVGNKVWVPATESTYICNTNHTSSPAFATDIAFWTAYPTTLTLFIVNYTAAGAGTTSNITFGNMTANIVGSNSNMGFFYGNIQAPATIANTISNIKFKDIFVYGTNYTTNANNFGIVFNGQVNDGSRYISNIYVEDCKFLNIKSTTDRAALHCIGVDNYIGRRNSFSAPNLNGTVATTSIPPCIFKACSGKEYYSYASPASDTQFSTPNQAVCYRIIQDSTSYSGWGQAVDFTLYGCTFGNCQAQDSNGALRLTYRPGAAFSKSFTIRIQKCNFVDSKFAGISIHGTEGASAYEGISLIMTDSRMNNVPCPIFVESNYDQPYKYVSMERNIFSNCGPIVTNNGTSTFPTTNIGIAEEHRLYTRESRIVLAGGLTDGYAASMNLNPIYTGVGNTVTRHNYINLANNPAGGATVTDAAVARFDAGIGTHKALRSAGTLATPGTVSGFVKININGTIGYLPIYQSADIT